MEVEEEAEDGVEEEAVDVEIEEDVMVTNGEG